MARLGNEVRDNNRYVALGILESAIRLMGSRDVPGPARSSGCDGMSGQIMMFHENRT